MLSIGYKKADIKLSVGYSSKRFGMTTLISSISKTGYKFKNDISYALRDVSNMRKVKDVAVVEICDYIEYHLLRKHLTNRISLITHGDEPLNFGFANFDVSGQDLIDELKRREVDKK